MGKLVVIEGLDGSGKATQTKLLSQALTSAGTTVRTVSFPNYASNSSALVKMYLAGDFGSDPEDVNAWAASTFYAVDRYASYKSDWGGFYDGGGLVLADRYATSNIIHQCSKLPRAEWPGFIAWMEDLEYQKLGIPKPDLVLHLDVDPVVSQALLERRYGENGGGDIHERDLAYLMRCRKAALWCAEALGWRVVPGCRDGTMRPVEEITRELYEIIEQEVL